MSSIVRMPQWSQDDCGCETPSSQDLMRCWKEIAQFKAFLQQVLTEMGVGGATVSLTAPTTPTMGQLWWNGSALQLWNGTAWVAT